MSVAVTALASRIFVREVDDGRVADALFQRCYGTTAPEYPFHVIAFWYDGVDEVPLCYIHFFAQGEFLLGGGACVDKAALRRLPGELRAAIRTVGGLYQYSLTWAVRHFSTSFAAVFGYCGDALAERIDRAVGFESTPYPRLLVYWTRAVDAVARERMIERANAVGPF